MVGAPAHSASLTPGRYDLAPAAIRKALDEFTTFDINDSVNLLDLAMRDAGDLDVGAAPADLLEVVRRAVSEALTDSDALVMLGGDGTIAYPGAMALEDCGLIAFNSYLDTGTTSGGLNSGSTIRALLDRGFPGERIVAIGIQSFANTEAQMNVARDAGIRVAGAAQVRERGIRRVVGDALESFTEGLVYVHAGLDVLDRAYAPGAPGSRPGGLTPGELNDGVRLCGEFARVRVLDIAGLDPERDTTGHTALCAAACLLNFASGVHRRCSRLSVARNL